MAIAPADPAVHARPDPSPGRTAALIALAWLPAIVVAASLPQYARTFDRWPAHRELPPLTLALTLAAAGLFAAIYHPVGLAIVTQRWKNTGMRLGTVGDSSTASVRSPSLSPLR